MNDFFDEPMNAWELPEIEFTETTVFCERCKPYGKCLALKWLDHKSWLESPYYHNAEADKIIEESAPSRRLFLRRFRLRKTRQ